MLPRNRGGPKAVEAKDGSRDLKRGPAILTVILLLALIVLVSRSDAARAKHSPRFLVGQALNRGLAGSPMAGTGFALEAAGWRWKIQPAFIAAIAAKESSRGVAACRNNRFNAWGLASCGTGWHVPTFRSWSEAYQFMGRFLSSRWPQALVPWDYAGYAAYVGTPSCSSCWGTKGAGFMRDLFGSNVGTRYGSVWAVD